MLKNVRAKTACFKIGHRLNTWEWRIMSIVDVSHRASAAALDSQHILIIIKQ